MWAHGAKRVEGVDVLDEYSYPTEVKQYKHAIAVTRLCQQSLQNWIAIQNKSTYKAINTQIDNRELTKIN